MKEDIETKDVQRTEYLDKNGLDMLWAKVKENTRNQVEVESNRAVTQETRIIETKADKSELDNYVTDAALKALEKKVSANTAAISGKQDAGNYLHYETINNEGYYEIPSVCVSGSAGSTKTNISSQSISINDDSASFTTITPDSIVSRNNDSGDFNFALDRDGLKLEGGDDFSVLTSNASTIDITQYAKKTEVSDFISKTTTNDQSIESRLNISNALKINGDNNESYAVFSPTSNDIQLQMIGADRSARTYLDPSSLQISKSIYNITITANGIRKSDGSANNVYATDGSIADLTQYAKKSEITARGNVDDVQVNGVSVVENKIANIKPATKESLGVVKVGDGLNVTDGTISVDSTAIGAGNYLPYERYTSGGGYDLPYNNDFWVKKTVDNYITSTVISPGRVIANSNQGGVHLGQTTNGYGVSVDYGSKIHSHLNYDSLIIYHYINNERYIGAKLNKEGIFLLDGDNNHVLTSHGSTIDITQYVLKSVYDEKIAALEARIAALEAKHAETA